MGLIYLFYLFIVKPKSKVHIPVKGLGVTLKSHRPPREKVINHPKLLEVGVAKYLNDDILGWIIT